MLVGIYLSSPHIGSSPPALMASLAALKSRTSQFRGKVVSGTLSQIVEVYLTVGHIFKYCLSNTELITSMDDRINEVREKTVVLFLKDIASVFFHLLGPTYLG